MINVRLFSFGVAIIVVSGALSACGKPAGMSDEDYAEYRELGAPKILYSCDLGNRLSLSDFEKRVGRHEKCRDIVRENQECHEKAERLTGMKAHPNCEKLSAEVISCLEKTVTPLKGENVTVVNYVAGVGNEVTYNDLLVGEKESCEKQGGKFKVLDSKS